MGGVLAADFPIMCQFRCISTLLFGVFSVGPSSAVSGLRHLRDWVIYGPFWCPKNNIFLDPPVLGVWAREQI